MAAEPDEMKQIIDQVEADYDADVFLYSGPIDDEGFGKLVSEVADNKRHNKALVILTTGGGLANSAYQIGRLLQRSYDEFILYTPRFCKSAGTLIALAANRLIMDQFSELGPLDVQLYSKDELFVRRSGLLSRSAFESLSETSYQLFEHLMLQIKIASGNQVTFRKASELAATMTGTLMSNIYSQINPDTIGSDARDLQIAKHYGDRLASRSRNVKSGTVDRLIRNYPSHDFIIDDEECAVLFENVEPPRQSLYHLVAKLTPSAFQLSDSHLIMAIRLENSDIDTDQGETGHETGSEESDDPKVSPDKLGQEQVGVDGSREEHRSGHPRSQHTDGQSASDEKEQG